MDRQDNRFLVTSPNAYNTLGVGTTQLYNKKTVYNHKRHGNFTLGIPAEHLWALLAGLPRPCQQYLNNVIKLVGQVL
ncbi:hypothetical protein EON81_21775, partial [bacterium]